RITGNLEEGDNPEEGDNARITSSSWRPAGRIRVWDDQEGETRRSRSVFDHWEYYECDDDGFLLLLKIEPIEPCRRAVYRTEYYTIPGSYVPVQGVEVRARRWITTHEDYTDSNGYYSCNGTFKRDANYSIKWERYDFLIRDKWLSAATDNGPKKTGDWNNNYQGGVQEYYSHIFRATHHYYYKDINGLRRPPENSFWKTQLKIRANLEEDSDKCGEDDFVGCHSPGRRFLGLGNSIQMYSYNRSARDIYATMIHELAHASQWVNDHYYYQDKDDERKIAESWARGVEWNLTRMVYRNNYLGRARRTNDYTLVVADMIDGPATPDTRTNFGYIDSRDNVEGYTIRQIEDALNGQTTWNGWRNNIRNRYNNATKDNLDVLFSAYE
ncbi:MAG: hypothetical protein GY816_15805, partial [Cytophagales bacterium]|nr:hypothetical protein [Cytophagales bacterium]